MADAKKEYNSKYRVAIASTDGSTVNCHYGRAEKFYIYAIDDEEGFDLLEERHVNPVCLDGSHIQNDMEKSVKNLNDCKYVAASRIGSGAIQSLTANGITGMELPGDIEEAILKIWKYNRIQGLFG